MPSHLKITSKVFKIPSSIPHCVITYFTFLYTQFMILWNSRATPYRAYRGPPCPTPFWNSFCVFFLEWMRWIIYYNMASILTILNSLEANFKCSKSAFTNMRRSHCRRERANWQKSWTGAKQKLWLFLLLWHLFSTESNITHDIHFNIHLIIHILKEIFQ